MESKGIELRLISTQRIRDVTPDPAAAKRKADQESARQKALVFAEEALLECVSTMRATKDPNVKLKAAKMIMDRAWGVPRSADEEGEKIANQSIIELLASMSTEYVPLAREEVKQITNAQPNDIEGLLVDASDD